MFEKIRDLLKRQDPYLWRNRLATLERGNHIGHDGTLTTYAQDLCGVKTGAELRALAAEEASTFALKSAATHTQKQAELESAQRAADAAQRQAQEDEARRIALAANVKKLEHAINNLSEQIIRHSENGKDTQAALAQSLFALNWNSPGDPAVLAAVEYQSNWLATEGIRGDGLRAALKLAQDRLATEQAELEALI